MSGRMYRDSDTIRHFEADPEYKRRRGVKGKDAFVEVRYDDASRTTVDEIVTTNLHLEMMDEDRCWMEVNGLHVWFSIEHVKGRRRPRLRVTCFGDQARPAVVTRGEADR